MTKSKDEGERGGRGPGGTSPAGGGRTARSKPDPIQLKARQTIEQTGLPMYAAVEVARGRWTVEHAFDQVRLKAEMYHLSREQGISMALAGQVARRQLTLEAAVLCSRMRADSRLCGTRSALDEASRSGEPLLVALLGGEHFVGRIVENSPFSLKLEVQDKEPLSLQKHDLALVCTPGVWVEAQDLISTDEAVKALGLKGTGKVAERFRLKDRDLYPPMMASVPVKITLRDGMQVSGIITWFGRWEIGLDVAGGGEVVTFRHALHGIEPAAAK